MLNAIEAFKPISTIKRMFPGAEIIDGTRTSPRRMPGFAAPTSRAAPIF